jgi:hypothetical protein
MSKLKELLEEAGMTTFVPLANTVGIPCQLIYCRKKKEDGQYDYDLITQYLEKKSGKGIEQLVEEAKEHTKEAKRLRAEAARADRPPAPRKQYSYVRKPYVSKKKRFAIGDLVHYESYKVLNSEKIPWTVEGTICDITESGLISIERKDKTIVVITPQTAQKCVIIDS